MSGKTEPTIYVRPDEPMDEEERFRIRKYIRYAINKKARGDKPYFNVGDNVWCVFDDTPEGKVEEGWVIEVRTGPIASVFRVALRSGKSEYFLERDIAIGHIRLKEEELKCD